LNRVRSRGLVLACALAGSALGSCAEAPPEDPPENDTWAPKSGSRLKARYLVDETGTRVFAGWFDEQRGEYCRVARGEAGRYYCFPFANRSLFADPRCQQPVGVHGACAMRYAATTRGDLRCDNESMAVWQEAGDFTLPSVYSLSNDTCRGPDLPAVTSGILVNTTGRLAEAQLVGGDARPPRMDLKLASRVVQFDDGAKAPAVLMDYRWSRCSPALTATGLRCVPDAAVYVGTDGPFFDDASCSTKVAHADAPACLTPKVAVTATLNEGCPLIDGAYAVGRRRDARSVYASASCQRGQPLPGVFYELGASLGLDAFPALQVEERGQGRIRVRTFAAGDGAPLPYLGVRLFDSALGVPCRVVPVSDGTLRCLPVDGPARVDAAAAARFADNACQIPLARMASTRIDCMDVTPTVAMAARVSQQSCSDGDGSGLGALGDLSPGRWQMHGLGVRHDGPLFQQSAAGCVEALATAGDSYYTLGAAIDPGAFVAFRQE
jgi:hypothetical protein